MTRSSQIIEKDQKRRELFPETLSRGALLLFIGCEKRAMYQQCW